jgi:glycine cleavage system H protein
MVPEELRYTSEHEWVLLSEDGTVRVGVTDYAQTQLGDVVYIQLPPLGDSVKARQPVGEIESTKSVSDVFAPVDGEVVGCNDALDNSPDLVNSDPYGAGWMIEIKPVQPGAVDSLMTAKEYQAHIGEG